MIALACIGSGLAGVLVGMVIMAVLQLARESEPPAPRAEGTRCPDCGETSGLHWADCTRA